MDAHTRKADARNALASEISNVNVGHGNFRPRPTVGMMKEGPWVGCHEPISSRRKLLWPNTTMVGVAEPLPLFGDSDDGLLLAQEPIEEASSPLRMVGGGHARFDIRRAGGCSARTTG